MNKKTILYIAFMALIILFVPIQALASTNIQELSDDMVILPQSLDTSFSWKLKSNESNTKSVYLNKNETITVTAMLSSSSSRSRIGIIDLDNTYNVKSILGAGSYSYTASKSGTYKIYCKNTSSITLTTVINYSIE